MTPVSLNGWDNTTFRLGDNLSIRLPSGEGYAGAVAKEQRWLPELGPQLPLPIPQPVTVGRPGGGYPWSWSIYRWLQGTPASLAEIADLGRFAADLADFLTALYAIDASSGPPAGPDSAYRGCPLTHYDDEEIPAAIKLLPDRIDRGRVRAGWQRALSSRWQQPPVWMHGDLVGSNLLVVNGSLSAVIDFGCAAVGDPACDLAIAWTFFDEASRQQFVRRLPLDEETWNRGRGWALWKALITIRRAREKDGDEYADARRFGWRFDPYQVVDLVLSSG